MAAALGPALLPYLLVIAYSLSFVVNDAKDMPSPGVLLLTIGAALLAVIVVHLFLALLFRQTPARELLLFELVAFLVLYGYLRMSTSSFLPRGWFLCGWSLLFGLLAFGTWRAARGPTLRTASTLLLFVLVALVALQSTWLALGLIPDLSRVAHLQVAQPQELQETMPAGAARAGRQPDIYYIILDAYGRRDALRDFYQHDNGPFVDELRERGFFVGRQSRSNYHLTELSLASSLNMEYLQGLGLEEFNTRAPLHKLIEESAVARYLKRRGYRTISFATGKSATECRSSDCYVTPAWGLNDYQDVLLHSTAIPDLLSALAPARLTLVAAHRRRIDRTLDQLPRVAGNSEKPAFVFAHIMAPHPPFVFGASGEPVDMHGQYLLADGHMFLKEHNWDRGQYTLAYRNQLTYLNVRLLQLVDQILNNDRPAVVVLQGDHGPRSRFDLTRGSELREGFSILNAVLLGDGNGSVDAGFYDSASPVNTFRLIFNHYFDAGLKRLEDRSFFEESAYQFVDVTKETLPWKIALSP